MEILNNIEEEVKEVEKIDELLCGLSVFEIERLFINGWYFA